MEQKPIREKAGSSSREIQWKASRNARLAQRYAACLLVIVCLFLKKNFVGWTVFAVDCLSEIVETATQYYYDRKKSRLGALVLNILIFAGSAFLAISGMMGR